MSVRVAIVARDARMTDVGYVVRLCVRAHGTRLCGLLMRGVLPRVARCDVVSIS